MKFNAVDSKYFSKEEIKSKHEKWKEDPDMMVIDYFDICKSLSNKNPGTSGDDVGAQALVLAAFVYKNKEELGDEELVEAVQEVQYKLLMYKKTGAIEM